MTIIHFYKGNFHASLHFYKRKSRTSLHFYKRKSHAPLHFCKGKFHTLLHFCKGKWTKVYHYFVPFAASFQLFCRCCTGNKHSIIFWNMKNSITHILFKHATKCLSRIILNIRKTRKRIDIVDQVIYISYFERIFI